MVRSGQDQVRSDQIRSDRQTDRQTRQIDRLSDVCNTDFSLFVQFHLVKAFAR